MTGYFELLIAFKATIVASLTKKRDVPNRGLSQPLATRIAWAFGRARARASRFGRRVANALGRWADAHAAAALYQNLSRLSDTELARRGMHRADLHHHVSEASADNDSRANKLD
jgi:hypothetical protein